MEAERFNEVLDHFGFAVIEDLIPREAALATARAMQEMAVPHGGNDVVFGNLPESAWPTVIEMVTHPIAQALAEHALGPEFKMIGECGRLWSEPGQDAGGLHADLPVSGWWRRAGRPFPVNNPCLQAIWALTDFTLENGATQVVPFTHTSSNFPRPDIDYSTYLRSLEMPAGSLAAFDCRIWHRRGANRTKEDRLGMSVPYIAQWLDPVTTGWKIMPRDVWRRVPESIQRLNPHVDDAVSA